MKKILALTIVIALAALITIWLLYHPGTVAFVVAAYVIKLPLWLFVICLLAFFIIFVVLLTIVHNLMTGPRRLWNWHLRARENRAIAIMQRLAMAHVLRDHHTIKQHYSQK